MNLLDALSHRSAAWWVTTSLAGIVLTLGLFVWDTRADNRKMRESLIVYMQTDQRAMLQALGNNTVALEQNTRAMQKIANKEQ